MKHCSDDIRADVAPSVAIVDYGMGNLFSVGRACEAVGLRAVVTADRAEVLAADAIIVPGVGAFGQAMESLRRRDLVTVLQAAAAEGKPLMGVCLGLQLFMTESWEFGRHEGLDLIEGEVVRLRASDSAGRALKVPHVGWNRLRRPAEAPVGHPWRGTPLARVAEGTAMYFVHSFHAQPQKSDVVLSVSRYGDAEFCSSLRLGNIFACQFHPERSGPAGLAVYRNFAALITGSRPGIEESNEVANRVQY